MLTTYFQSWEHIGFGTRQERSLMSGLVTPAGVCEDTMLHMDSLKAIFRILSKEVTLCLCMRVGSHLKMMHFNSGSLVGKLMSADAFSPRSILAVLVKKIGKVFL